MIRIKSSGNGKPKRILLQVLSQHKDCNMTLLWACSDRSRELPVTRCQAGEYCFAKDAPVQRIWDSNAFSKRQNNVTKRSSTFAVSFERAQTFPCFCIYFYRSSKCFCSSTSVSGQSALIKIVIAKRAVGSKRIKSPTQRPSSSLEKKASASKENSLLSYLVSSRRQNLTTCYLRVYLVMTKCKESRYQCACFNSTRSVNKTSRRS